LVRDRHGAREEMIIPLDRSRKLIRRKPLKHVKLRRYRKGAGSLTLCIAALAEHGEAIVCIADKMLSFGDLAQWESDVTKIIPIPKTTVHALIAGSLGHCESVLSEIRGVESPDESPANLVASLETVYKAKYTHFQETEILHKRGLSKAAYENALASPAVSIPMQQAAAEMEQYYFDCDVMLCGINDSYSPYIVSAAPPGIVHDFTRQGFNSIGIGADIANPRMLWS
jgi:hypothetical protein